MKLPRHIAFIPDGNRRWATSHNLSVARGHEKGVETLADILQYCYDLNVAVISVYAFSYENWTRPEDEKKILFTLIDHFLETKLASLIAQQVNIRFIGDSDAFPASVQTSMEKAKARTQHFKKHTLQIALGYGGRDEIIRAVRAISLDIAKQKILPANIDEELFTSYLDTHDLPDPDLVIRTSGEYRISNFLLYQIAYSELYFTATLWPDFSTNELKNALAEYAKRDRRFGGKLAQATTPLSF